MCQSAVQPGQQQHQRHLATPGRDRANPLPSAFNASLQSVVWHVGRYPAILEVLDMECIVRT
jgi:hypothetical protein